MFLANLAQKPPLIPEIRGHAERSISRTARILHSTARDSWTGPLGLHIDVWLMPRMSGGVCRTVPRVFTPVLAKHSRSFSRIDCIAVGVDRMQWNFEAMRKQVETWQRSELTDVTAKVVIYEAFVEGKLAEFLESCFSQSF